MMGKEGEGHAERGVSEVVGIVLLVGVTLLLVTVLAGVVVGTNALEEPAPNADFYFDYDKLASGPTGIAITHIGGDSIRAGTMTIVVEADGTERERWRWHEGDVDVDSGNEFVAGGTATWNATTINPGENAVVQIRWEDPNGADTYIIAESEVPESER